MFWLHSLSATLVAKSKLFKGLLNIAQQRSPIIIQKMRKKVTWIQHCINWELCFVLTRYEMYTHSFPIKRRDLTDTATDSDCLRSASIHQHISRVPKAAADQLQGLPTQGSCISNCLKEYIKSLYNWHKASFPHCFSLFLKKNLLPWYFWNIRFILLL